MRIRIRLRWKSGGKLDRGQKMIFIRRCRGGHMSEILSKHLIRLYVRNNKVYILTNL